MKRWVFLGVLAAAAAVFASFCIVILDERELAFRTLLGNPEPQAFGISLNRPVLDEPGLYVRIPGLHTLYLYDKRVLRYQADPEELLMAEKYALEVDYYLMYRIVNPRLLRQDAPNLEAVRRLIDDTAPNELRTVLSRTAFTDLLSERRSEVTAEIANHCNEKLSTRGIEVVDFRIRRTDHPEANRERIFDRMRTERERVAKRYRAEGEEEARKIRSDAEKQSEVLAAEGQREALKLRGDGDATAARVYADAYGQDREFYSFVRSLEAYRSALDGKTTLILSPDSPFLKYLFDVAAPPTR